MARHALPVLSALALLALSTPLLADEVSVKLDTDVGTLGNADIDGHGACYATSVINSFWYLEQKYSSVYGTELTGGTEAGATSARDSLHKLIWDDEGYQDREGNQVYWTWEEAWEEKVNWIEDRVEGVTEYKGMFAYSVSGWSNAENLIGNKAPTWDFLWQEIDEDEDVEIFFEWKIGQTTYAHAVTLTSLEFEDTYADGVWNPSARGEWAETAYFDFRDPNNAGETTYAQVTKDEAGNLVLYYEYGKDADGNPVYYEATVYGAFSESYVPLPGAFLAGSALLALMAIARRRRK